MEKFNGIFPALLTPFTKEDKIDEAALRSLIRLNLDKKVKGFYVGGSTAEAFLMTLEERKQILSIVMDESAGACTIISHIGCISTTQAAELGRFAEELGVDAVSSVPPFYYNFSFAEIRNYYFDLIRQVKLPMIIYNIPAFSGVTFTSDNLGEIFENEQFIGVKHTSNDFFSLERFKQKKESMLVFNGYDEVFLSGLAAGADGGIGSTYNIMAEKYIEILDLFEKGKMKEAGAVQTKANHIIKALVKVGVMPGEKALLTHLGIPFGGCRKPFKPLTPEETKFLVGVYEENK